MPDDTLRKALSKLLAKLMDCPADGDYADEVGAIIALLARTPLSVILDALGIPYRTGVLDPGSDHEGVPWRAAEDRETLEGTFLPTVPVLVVDIPATGEARDG